MKKFSSNYVLSPDGALLKYGIVAVNDEGVVVGLTDTGGNLRETDRLEFHSGILVPGICPVAQERISSETENFQQLISEIRQCSGMNELFAVLKKFQEENPEESIPEIWHLLQEKGFTPGNRSGIYVISGADLVHFRLKPDSRLKKLG